MAAEPAESASGSARSRGVTASLRVRLTLGASIVVAGALATSATAITVLHAWTLRSNVDHSLEVRANDLAVLLVDGTLPSVLSVQDSEDALVQVLGPDGRVVAASANMQDEPPLVQAFVPQRLRELRTVDALPIDDESFRVLAQRHERVDGLYVIYVAENLEPVGESTAALTRIFVVAVPLLVLLVAVLTWDVVGRALSPVEAMRAEVAAIGASEDLRRRVPEPAAQDEVGRLARTMNEMLGRLQTARQRQERFVADASHELRSPLTGIRAQIEVDLAHPAEARPLETERAVLDEIVRLERLVDDLLLLARAERSGRGELVPIDLDDLVLAEIARLRTPSGPDIEGSGVSGAQVVGDAEQLRRAVRNLLENAVRFARKRVSVSLSEDGDEVTFAVSNDGPSVPAEARERIFERFTRLDESRSRSAGGAGLGLAITSDIAARHGGRVYVDPDFGPDGARFVLRLRVAGPPPSGPDGAPR